MQVRLPKHPNRGGVKTTNIAVVGAGYWGPNLLRNFHQLQEAHVSWVCDSDEARLQRIRQLYPTVRTTLSFDEVLADTDTTAVAIATPAETHYPLAKRALQSGKNVFVEKPLALSAAHAGELVALAKEKGTTLMVGHTFLYNAAVTRLKEYVTSGELGDILYLYAQRLNLGQVRQDVNVLWNLAPHDVSILLHLLDEQPQRVSARGIAHLRDGIEDFVFATLEFSNKRTAHLHVSWLDPNKIRRFTIVGSRKMVVFDDVSSSAKIQLYDKGVTKFASPQDFAEFQLQVRTGDLVVPSIPMREPLRMECQHFLDCIHTGKTPISDGVNGLRVTEVLEATQTSLKSDGAWVDVVPLELPS